MHFNEPGVGENSSYRGVLVAVPVSGADVVVCGALPAKLAITSIAKSANATTKHAVTNAFLSWTRGLSLTENRPTTVVRRDIRDCEGQLIDDGAAHARLLAR